MRKVILIGAVLAASLATARAYTALPPGPEFRGSLGGVATSMRWAIVTSMCWHIPRSGKGQCAVGLNGPYPSRVACIAANNGRLAVTTPPGGPPGRERQFFSRCEILWENWAPGAGPVARGIMLPW